MLAALFALLTTVATAAPVYDPAPITAADLLARADNANGTLAAGSYIRTYTADSGGLHTEGATKIAGDDRETVEHTGPFTTAFGVFRGQHWQQDENGTVVIQTRFHDTEDPDANALAQADTSSAVHVLGITHDAPQEYVLEVTPHLGPREVRFYDAHTYLLDRIELTGSGGRTRTWTYSHYRPAFGELIPFTTTYSDGRPANDETLQITSFVQAPVQLAGIPATRKLIDASQTKPVSIAATFDRNGIVVPVKIGDRSYNFVLDSGASNLALAPKVVAELGLHTYGLSRRYIGGAYDESRAIAPDVAIGDLHLHNVTFDVIPVDRPMDRDNIVGLLGLDFWSSAIIGIDYKNKTLTLYPPNTNPPDPAGLGVMPIALDDGIPRAPASIEGISGNFLLDTGSDGTILYRSFFNRLHSKTPMNASVGVEMIGGTQGMSPYIVDDFALGNAQFKHASVIVPSNDDDDMPEYDGAIGRNVMQYYVMYFDYEGHAIYLKPNV